MKILLVGQGGIYNRGCEAILRSTIMMLNKELNNPEITVSSFDCSNDKLANFEKNVKFIRSHLNKMWDRWTQDWFIRQMCKIFFKKKYWKIEFLTLFNAIQKADVVISVGGDNYSLDYGEEFLDYFLRLNRLIKEMNKKLVIWGASIGPFPDSNRIKEIILNLQTADLITCRESCSMDYLYQLGIVDNVRRVADTAFLLPAERISFGKYDISNLDNTLGVNISPILSRYCKTMKDVYIKNVISIFLREIIKNKGLKILLIPHVINKNRPNNDYTFMEGIYKDLQDTNMISLVSSTYNAIQTKYIISKCRFFIGARTHSTIASLSSEVPTLSVGYSLKAKGINKDIFGNYDFLLDINDFSLDNLREKFLNLYNREDQIRKVLSEKIPQLKEFAWDNIR